MSSDKLNIELNPKKISTPLGFSSVKISRDCSNVYTLKFFLENTPANHRYIFGYFNYKKDKILGLEYLSKYIKAGRFSYENQGSTFTFSIIDNPASIQKRIDKLKIDQDYNLSAKTKSTLEGLKRKLKSGKFPFRSAYRVVITPQERINLCAETIHGFTSLSFEKLAQKFSITLEADKTEDNFNYFFGTGEYDIHKKKYFSQNGLGNDFRSLMKMQKNNNKIIFTLNSKNPQIVLRIIKNILESTFYCIKENENQQLKDLAITLCSQIRTKTKDQKISESAFSKSVSKYKASWEHAPSASPLGSQQVKLIKTQRNQTLYVYKKTSPRKNIVIEAITSYYARLLLGIDQAPKVKVVIDDDGVRYGLVSEYNPDFRTFLEIHNYEKKEISLEEFINDGEIGAQDAAAYILADSDTHFNNRGFKYTIDRGEAAFPLVWRYRLATEEESRIAINPTYPDPDNIFPITLDDLKDFPNCAAIKPYHWITKTHSTGQAKKFTRLSKNKSYRQQANQIFLTALLLLDQDTTEDKNPFANEAKAHMADCKKRKELINFYTNRILALRDNLLKTPNFITFVLDNPHYIHDIIKKFLAYNAQFSHKPKYNYRQIDLSEVIRRYEKLVAEICLSTSAYLSTTSSPEDKIKNIVSLQTIKRQITLAHSILPKIHLSSHKKFTSNEAKLNLSTLYDSLLNDSTTEKHCVIQPQTALTKAAMTLNQIIAMHLEANIEKLIDTRHLNLQIFAEELNNFYFFIAALLESHAICSESEKQQIIATAYTELLRFEEFYNRLLIKFSNQEFNDAHINSLSQPITDLNAQILILKGKLLDTVLTENNSSNINQLLENTDFIKSIERRVIKKTISYYSQSVTVTVPKLTLATANYFACPNPQQWASLYTKFQLAKTMLEKNAISPELKKELTQIADTLKTKLQFGNKDKTKSTSNVLPPAANIEQVNQLPTYNHSNIQNLSPEQICSNHLLSTAIAKHKMRSAKHKELFLYVYSNLANVIQKQHRLLSKKLDPYLSYREAFKVTFAFLRFYLLSHYQIKSHIGGRIYNHDINGQHYRIPHHVYEILNIIDIHESKLATVAISEGIKNAINNQTKELAEKFNPITSLKDECKKIYESTKKSTESALSKKYCFFVPARVIRGEKLHSLYKDLDNKLPKPSNAA